MGLSNALKDKAETFAIGYVIHGIEAGRYGPRVQAVWLALKGSKAIIGFSIFAIGGALTAFPDPSLVAFGQTLAVIGSYLGRFGLISRGVDKAPPPKFPEQYRPAAVFALSMATYIVETCSFLGLVFMMSSHQKLQSASLIALGISQAISTATGYFSTLIGPTPAQAAATALVSAVKAADVAEAKVDAAENAARDLDERDGK